MREWHELRSSYKKALIKKRGQRGLNMEQIDNPVKMAGDKVPLMTKDDCVPVCASWLTAPLKRCAAPPARSVHLLFFLSTS